MKNNTRSTSVLPAVIVMCFLFSMISFVTGLQDPFGVIVRAQFHASNFMSQLGNAANFIAYACMGLPAGILLRKYGYKVTTLLAIAIGFVGVSITFLSGVVGMFWVYLTGAFVSGFSMCMLNSVTNPMLNTIGGGGARGNQFIQIGNSCNSLNATIVPVLVGYLIGEVSQDTCIADANPALFIAMAIFAIAFVTICIVPIPEPELEAARLRMEAHDYHEEKLGESIRATLRFRHFVLGAIAVWLYVGLEVSIANVTNLYLTSSEIGIIPAVSGTIVGTYWLLMLVGRMLCAIFGAKIKPNHLLTIVASACALLLLVGIAVGNRYQISFPSIDHQTLRLSLHLVPAASVFFVLCGLCTSVMWGTIFNLSTQDLGSHTSMASGLFMMMVFGGGMLPLIQSRLADAFGFIPSYIVPMLAVLYILWYALWGSRPKTEGK